MSIGTVVQNQFHKGIRNFIPNIALSHDINRLGADTNSLFHSLKLTMIRKLCYAATFYWGVIIYN